MGKKNQEKKQEKEKFIRSKLVKEDTGITLISIYEVEVEKETEKGKKEAVKEIVEKTEDYLTVEELDQKIRKKLEIYGLYVKVQRSAAGIKSEKKKLETWKQTIQALKDGEWERKPTHQNLVEKAKLELLNSIKDPELKKKLKKELGLA